MIALISQREEENKFGCSVDVLESSYIKYFQKKDIILIPISNLTKDVKKYFDLKPDFIILSGGMSSKNRDNVETKLLKISINNKIPVLGICKGFQFINLFFNGKLFEVEHHVVKNHEIKFNGNKFNVNSFHNLGFNKDKLGKGLVIIAKDNNGIVEAIIHEKFPILGVQWHPERECPNNKINELTVDMFIKNNGELKI